MEKDWIIVRTYDKAYLAEIAKEVLEDNGIKAVIMNKKDSSYKFGEIEVYVAKSHEAKASELLKDLQ